MTSLFQHFQHHCHNIGVNAGPEEHSTGVLAAIRAGWVETILNWGDTKSVIFDGVFHQGHGGTWVRQGALENVVVVVTYDHSWKTGGPLHPIRHREIRYDHDYDVRVSTLPGFVEGEEGKADGPYSGLQVTDDILDTKHD